MLFRGAPGCGKTSCIKAIARRTGRHIVIIPTGRMLTADPDRFVDVLKEIMLSPQIGDLEVPLDKRLYVFEEADTWQDLLEARQMQAPVQSMGRGNHPDASGVLAGLLKQAQRPHLVGQHVLGGLLELMDGIVEMPGRMCIMTTNHPEKLDPAMTRPGRFGDVNIEFKRYTREDVANMYRAWFDAPLPTAVFARLTDHVWCQADLGQLFESTGGHEDLLRRLHSTPAPRRAETEIGHESEESEELEESEESEESESEESEESAMVTGRCLCQ